MDHEIPGEWYTRGTVLRCDLGRGRLGSVQFPLAVAARSVRLDAGVPVFGPEVPMQLTFAPRVVEDEERWRRFRMEVACKDRGIRGQDLVVGALERSLLYWAHRPFRKARKDGFPEGTADERAALTYEPFETRKAWATAAFDEPVAFAGGPPARFRFTGWTFGVCEDVHAVLAAVLATDTADTLRRQTEGCTLPLGTPSAPRRLPRAWVDEALPLLHDAAVLALAGPRDGEEHGDGAPVGVLMERIYTRAVDNLVRRRESGPEAAEVPASAEAPHALAEALVGLTTQQQDVLLRRAAGMSDAEVADDLGLAVTVVRAALARARAHLRDGREA